jgi:CHAT domain-containing protein
MGKPDSFEMTVRALKYIFDAQEWQNRRFIGSSLTPALSSRLVVLLAAAMLTHNRTANAEEASLVLQAVELVTRSARFKDSDALADLASAITATDRGATHALLRTRSREAYRRNSLIVDKLTEVIDAGLEPSRLAAVDFDLHRGLAELANRNTSLETYLDDGPQLSGISFFPTAEDVQAHLSEGEVLLFLAPSLGPLMISICVTPRTVSAVSFSVDKATMLADLRLLGAALTSTHSPSIALDTQYPVNAARRVYQAILGNRAAGPYKCIEKGDTVFLAPPDAFGGVPLEVTLAEEPQRDDVGWILGTATWAFQNNDFVYIPSVRAFVALRQLQRRASPRSNDVLSVGDPRLYDSGQASENYLSAITRGLPSGTKAGALRALRELPNTADEASQVYQLLGGSGRLLIGGAATERTLRSDFLSGYRYIHFATHGLVREEIPGLQEAALVLTPGSTNDTFDDGLLTASEIADLSLNADVAVLSACNTANFDLAFFQSETQGLTTAFAIAGVPATVVTLWPVETFSSERIVTSFFQQFNEGTVRASRALSIARGAILTTENRAFHHPRFWGAFVIYGDVISGPASPVDGTDRVYTLAGYGGVRGVLPGLGPSETLIYWGPYRDDGPLSHVTKVDQLLDVVWQVDRSSFGRSQMLKGDDERLYVLGYELRGNLPYPAAFTVDGRSGEELAFRKLGEPDEPGFIVGYVLTASDNLFLMTAQAKDPYGRDSEESKATYALHVLDQNLDTVKTERMPFDFRGGMPLNSGLAASDEYLLVFAQEPESYELPQPRIGRFGAFESCPTQRDTHVIWISRDDDESPLLEIANGIDIRRVIFSQEDGFVFVGTEDFECSFDKRMVVGRLMPGTGEWERIWTDPGPFGSTPAAIAEGAMGDLVIASSRRRTLDGRFGLSPPEESVFNPASGAPIGGMGSVSEGRVTWLKATGEIVEDRVFSAGLEVFIDGLSVTDQEVLIGGEVGAVPFVLSTPHPTTDAGATTH